MQLQADWLRQAQVAVVIPCYRVAHSILGVLEAIPEDVAAIYCVDDACPEGSGDLVEKDQRDPRVRVLRHESNRGVGAAFLTGATAAVAAGARIVVKIDGDGQMDPRQLPAFVWPIAVGRADYTKGNRFHRVAGVKAMPAHRLIGNALLTFLTKLSSGYWNVFDPTNGYLAIHSAVLRTIPKRVGGERFFFESDMLYHLGIARAVVEDVPMAARYGEESSSLRVHRVIGPFLWGHLRNLSKRILYGYFLRDFQVASVALLAGVAVLGFGSVFGALRWWQSIQSGVPATAGTVMLPGLCFLSGLQLLLASLNYDVQNVPWRPIHESLSWEDGGVSGAAPAAGACEGTEKS